VTKIRFDVNRAVDDNGNPACPWAFARSVSVSLNANERVKRRRVKRLVEGSTQVAFDLLPDPTDAVRITISKCGSIYTVVDPEFEDLVRRYTWSLHFPNPQRSRKAYARAERCPVTKQKLRLYMHRLICEAVHGPPPTPQHIADHRDNNGLNNRGENLRWRTKQANSWAPALGHARQAGLPA
jgi:hypothetical protein